jgi:hypothetical protein
VWLIFDYPNLILHDPQRRVMRVLILETQQPSRIRPGAETLIEEAPPGHVFETQEPWHWRWTTPSGSIPETTRSLLHHL